jgi:pimeloyl-ACP methyl ester carboxylesterase
VAQIPHGPCVGRLTGPRPGAVTGVLDTLRAERVHLVGHPMGGAVALAVTAREPRRVASLTLIAPSGFGPPGYPVMSPGRLRPVS